MRHNVMQSTHLLDQARKRMRINYYDLINELN
jgi:hypothetical protein